MPHNFPIFFMAAIILAITPGPGIFYVLARSLKILEVARVIVLGLMLSHQAQYYYSFFRLN